MSDLSGRSCKPCEGGVAPLTAAAAQTLMGELTRQWQLAADARGDFPILRKPYRLYELSRALSELSR